MKNLLAFTTLFSVIFLMACNDSAPKQSAQSEIPKATPVSEKIAEATTKAEVLDAPVSKEIKTETAILKEKEVKKTIEKKKTMTENTSTNKVKKATSQPTDTKKEASVSSTKTTKDATPPKAAENAPLENKKVKSDPKASNSATPPLPEKKKVLSHDAWNGLLQKNVSSSGKVNYKGFKSQKAALNDYLKDLAENTPTSSTPRKEAMAYWINAYNAFTVKLIVENYPVSSITKLEGGKPWDKKWIKLGGKTYSLNNIENDILRPKYKDARIHFAVNCAAQSCPPILNKAWTAGNLNANFEKQAKAFVNNPKFNKISADAMEISKIFEWYGEDFGNMVDYLNKYSTTKINSNAKVTYMEYDWALNE